jgi:RNA polymerase sigma-70 factor (ECF subfamily)
LSEEELTTVRSAVKRLPPDQRQAIEMAFFGGLDACGNRGALNEPLGTVKARIRRGMLKLRESLQAYT